MFKIVENDEQEPGKQERGTGEGVWKTSENRPTKSPKFPKKQKGLLHKQEANSEKLFV